MTAGFRRSDDGLIRFQNGKKHFDPLEIGLILPVKRPILRLDQSVSVVVDQNHFCPS